MPFGPQAFNLRLFARLGRFQYSKHFQSCRHTLAHATFAPKIKKKKQQQQTTRTRMQPNLITLVSQKARTFRNSKKVINEKKLPICVAKTIRLALTMFFAARAFFFWNISPNSARLKTLKTVRTRSNIRKRF